MNQRCKSRSLLAFLLCAGCASSAQTARSTAPPKAPVVSMRAKAAAAPAAPAAPAQVLAEADHAYDSQLGVARGDHFDVERQITVLREAVLLYQQFLDRADGRPELEPAVRKARERIDDAKKTIEFLEPSLSAGAPR
ncbi:MAG TPA: hypothetical protein VHB79_30215 [Polyangiaceae bacterium]|nr:hypothetical protein [Polyangiaceae bacterium]